MYIAQRHPLPVLFKSPPPVNDPRVERTQYVVSLVENTHLWQLNDLLIDNKMYDVMDMDGNKENCGTITGDIEDENIVRIGRKLAVYGTYLCNRQHSARSGHICSFLVCPNQVTIIVPITSSYLFLMTLSIDIKYFFVPLKSLILL